MSVFAAHGRPDNADKIVENSISASLVESAAEAEEAEAAPQRGRQLIISLDVCAGLPPI